MSATPTNWRDKYLQLLQQQERNDKRVTAQADQIQHLLDCLHIITEGLDEPLFRHVRKVQQGRGGLTGSALAELEVSVKAFANRRKEATERYQRGLKEIVEPLLKSSGGGVNKKALRGIRSKVDETHYLLQVVPMLSHMAPSVEAGVRASNEELAARGGWFSRLFGGGVGQESGEPVAQPQPAVEELAVATTGEQAEDLMLEDMADTPAAAASDAPRMSLVPIQNTDGQFAQVAGSVERVLTEVIDRVEPQVCVAEKVAVARNCLREGLNWQDLVPTLEAIRDLIFHAYLEVDGNFREYLIGLEQHLADILQLLEGVAGIEEGQLAGRELATAMRGETQGFESLLASAEDTEQVKSAINQYLQAIYEALNRYDTHQPMAGEETTEVANGDGGEAASVAGQLAALVAKIESMETAVQTTKAELAEAREQALTDPLTQLPNREAYNQRIHDEYIRWQRYQRPLTMAVCDIDKFKSVNDTYGHQVGDRVLQVFAKALHKRLREVDFLGRFGGEEFVVILPETDEDVAYNLMDKIRSALAGLPFSFRGEPVQITVSVGLSGFREGDSIEAVFARADQALYKAKSEGRNLCCRAE